MYEIDLDKDEFVIVFQGDLFNCRERMTFLEEEEIPCQIIGVEETLSQDGMPPVMQLVVLKEDIEDVVAIFAEVWKETLDREGLDADQIQQLKEDVVDLNAETIICPGCQTEISEVTEEGECIECGLFLGLPEDEVEEELAESAVEAGQEDESEEDEEEIDPLDGFDFGPYNVGLQDFREVFEATGLEDPQDLLDAAVEESGGKKSLSRKMLEAGAEVIKLEEEAYQAELDAAYASLDALDYDFSRKDFAEVMDDYDLEDPAALALAVRALEDGDKSLSRKELEKAATVLAENES